MAEQRVCLLVPHYNHAEQLRRFLPQLREAGLPIILIDDGSDPDQFSELRRLTDAVPELTLQRQEQNGGKGSAVCHGARLAAERGFTHFVQVDADGQHDLQSLPALLAAARNAPQNLVSGAPVFADDAPPSRRHGRKISLWWARVETLSMAIEDAMCGFRVYPVAAFLTICESAPVSSGMAFDTDIMVRFCWEGHDVSFVPVRVRYPEQGRSHFHVFRDNIRLSAMHTRLFFGMLRRLPGLMLRKTEQHKR